MGLVYAVWAFVVLAAVLTIVVTVSGIIGL